MRNILLVLLITCVVPACSVNTEQVSETTQQDKELEKLKELLVVQSEETALLIKFRTEAEEVLDRVYREYNGSSAQQLEILRTRNDILRRIDRLISSRMSETEHLTQEIEKALLADGDERDYKESTARWISAVLDRRSRVLGVFIRDMRETLELIKKTTESKK